MVYGKVLFTLFISLALVSCGGGDDGGGGIPVSFTGVFIDSPVQGLPYSTTPSGLSGRTGPNGEFQYHPGDRVVFTTGTLLLDGFAQPIITPFTLLGRTAVADVNHEWPVNLTRILMALDTTPGTDVLTMPTTILTLPANIFFSDTSHDFEAALSPTGLPIVPRAAAVAHLKKQFGIWGSWATTSFPSEVNVFTFLPDGSYLLAHDDDPAVPGSNDGMERGTYRWNADTNVFTYTIVVNTDGTGGLSNPGPTQTPPYTFIIDASGNTAVLRLGPNARDEIQLTRVIETANPLVGAWKLQMLSELESSVVITFLSDGTFTVAGDADDTVQAGIERGTYVFNSATGNLALTTIVDTNGAFGFNQSPTLPASSSEQVHLSSSLTADLDFMRLEDGTNVAFFTRIKVP